jgi:hypothetical protein
LGCRARPAGGTVGDMTTQIPSTARELIGSQEGVLTLAQAHACGLTDKYVVAALRAGRWQRLHAGVYGVFSGPPPRPTQLWVAVLRVGSEAVLSHHSAAELHGLLAAPAPAIHVMVSRAHRVAPIAGIAVHHSGRLDQARHPVLTPPRTRVEETVLDLAGAAGSLDDALGWALRACGSRRTTPDRLAAALARRARVRWRTELSATLGLAAQGVHSPLEYRYVHRVERPHGLPTGRRQNLVVRAGQRQYQDVTYQEYGLVVELDGQTAHPAEARWRDARRDNATTAVGRGTLRYGWADVTEWPCFVAGQVGDALAARGWTGVLRRCGRSCGLAGTGRAGT